ncbi:MAG: DMT family transporter [Rhodospirillaceae bacterium]|jgi:drug/metabolite transporter (DMT)-like permease|nr:DMT family transporter [Rhodospirillales bacterium]MBT6406979.1 DMT family transporter [Rhodospirillaceae bacterium]
MEQGKTPSILIGVLLMVCVATAVALDTVVVRLLVVDLHPFEIVFFRTLFSLVFMAPWIWRGGIAQFATKHPFLHLARAAGKLVALGAFFYAVSLMALADLTAIMFSMPLFAALGAWLFLGEKMRPLRMAATILGFLGVLIVIRPGGDTMGVGALFAVGAALIIAALGLAIKYLSAEEESQTIVFWNVLLLTPMALLASIPVWTWPSWYALAWLVFQGLLGVVAQLCFSKALQFGDASTLVPIDFLRLPIIAVIGFAAFGEVPGLWTWAGATVIFLAVILLVRDERRRGGRSSLPEPS